ncbi:hemolysin III [candidate division KSB3 bacterium]|uniref:Hemolysin III n=1 Tax=candidate division KSB3 bacterium TaxID=2044937 RepID=A0A2G6KFB6_9BACT|nr:MAG: hemolysin III [candidate division KSB3 bacterium]
MSTQQEHPAHFYNRGEEIANSISHGIGTGLSIAGLVVLIMYAAAHGNAWHVVSFSIFGSTLILLYLTSTLYHSFPMPGMKKVFRVLDHSAIFLLIAGTYTPFMLGSVRGAMGWSIFGIIWTLAVAGITLKVLYLPKFEKSAVALYIIMGWLCVFAFKDIVANISGLSLGFLILGGLSYTIGILFYVWEKLPYNHAIWHVFVLGGSIFHFFSVLYTAQIH